MIVFASRAGAGRLLADRLIGYGRRDDVVVLALPRGGVPVAFEVAEQLHVPLDVFVIRKIRTPGMPDVPLGFIGSHGTLTIDDDVVTRAQIPGGEVQYAVEIEQAEVDRREKAYRGRRPPVDIKDKTVILIDDGLSRASNTAAAVEALQRVPVARVVVAVPVADDHELSHVRERADEVVCLSVPVDYRATSFWYADYPPVWDEEVREILATDTVAVMAL